MEYQISNGIGSGGAEIYRLLQTVGDEVYEVGIWFMRCGESSSSLLLQRSCSFNSR
jgi:hypothetical protein